MKDIAIALDQTEKYIETNKNSIPDIVCAYILDVVKQDRNYVQLVKTLSEKTNQKHL